MVKSLCLIGDIWKAKHVLTPFGGSLGVISHKVLYDRPVLYLTYILSFVPIGLSLVEF